MEIRNVDVYRNLSQGCWSVKDRSDGRVIGRADAVIVTDATFVVQPAGRAKVLREGQKNVHAFVRGTLRTNSFNIKLETLNNQNVLGDAIDFSRREEALFLQGKPSIEATYNPYKFDSFVDASSKASLASYRAEQVSLETDGSVYAIGLTKIS